MSFLIVSFFRASASTEETAVDKEAPNFEVSGKLLEDTNTFNGVVVKYSEPPEARKPKRRWRFYVFKGEESLPTLHLHRQSAFLVRLLGGIFHALPLSVDKALKYYDAKIAAHGLWHGAVVELINQRLRVTLKMAQCCSW